MSDNIHSEISLREIKHEFMAFRNGITADILRQAGMPYSIIFGLQLPQITEIARRQSPSPELAQLLWADRNVRESRLLAAYLYPSEELTEDKAFEMASEVLTREEADILSFRLLRRLPFAEKLVSRLMESEEVTVKYCGEALKRNLEAMA